MRKNISILDISLEDRRAKEGYLPYRYQRKSGETNIAYYNRLLTILSFSGEPHRPLHKRLLKEADVTWALLTVEEQANVNHRHPTRTQHHPEPKE